MNKEHLNKEIQTLLQFLNYTNDNSIKIFNKFKQLPGAIFREQTSSTRDQRRFVYIEGTRKDKVVLIAHADTVFSNDFFNYKDDFVLNDYPKSKKIIKQRGNFFIGVDQFGRQVPIGADDRAGCAILWELRNSGHSLLIIDGEEFGLIGSSWLMTQNKDIARKINSHQFMIQFDRRGSNDFKCYNVGTPEFRKFIAKETSFIEPDLFSFTDIAVLCESVCGVNLSVGYYNEHTSRETINYKEWLNTLRITKLLLSKSLPKFSLFPKIQIPNNPKIPNTLAQKSSILNDLQNTYKNNYKI
jgi:hypothetical protein